LRVFNSEIPVKTPALQPYRYPDASVVCGKAEFENIEGIDTLINPTVIVEVLSPATKRRDRNEKRAAYQALPSLKEYLMLAQDAPHATHFSRQGDKWVRSDYSDLNLVPGCSWIGTPDASRIDSALSTGNASPFLRVITSDTTSS